MLGIPGGVEITSIADIPSRGTGLGSSSAFTVGLLHAMHGQRQEIISPENLAVESSRVEIELCGERIGKQDQYAAAFGGLNFIEFRPDDTVTVCPIVCPPRTLDELERSLLAFYTGITRASGSVTVPQCIGLARDPVKKKLVQRMVSLAHLLREELQGGRLDAFGEILHDNWMLKKELTEGVSSGQLDRWYEQARRAGASGGKLLGAGAGGFLLFYAPPERHPAIQAALSDLRRIDFRFEPRGSRIILNQP
jgi:D-glycero-alpha-D-manno-heptose-7-phosphate kinase